jgi:hypothetical protein
VWLVQSQDATKRVPPMVCDKRPKSVARWANLPDRFYRPLGQAVSHLPRPSSSPPEFRPFGRLKKRKKCWWRKVQGPSFTLAWWRLRIDCSLTAGRTAGTPLSLGANAFRDPQATLHLPGCRLRARHRRELEVSRPFQRPLSIQSSPYRPARF